jgi:hypothetical protein
VGGREWGVGNGEWGRKEMREMREFKSFYSNVAAFYSNVKLLKLKL